MRTAALVLALAIVLVVTAGLLVQRDHGGERYEPSVVGCIEPTGPVLHPQRPTTLPCVLPR
jgi:hypothetical protein